MDGLKRYRTLVYDNYRWDGFELRPDDIIISTPPKAGTTWSQMLCAMLVFDGTDYPDTMDNMSPWLDMCTRSCDDVFALLNAQQHRRFIKTHTPLDGLPQHPDVRYIVVGRDPRDIAVSFEHHLANMNFETFLATRDRAVGNHDLGDFPPPSEPSEDPRERMRQFIESEASITNFDSVLGHLKDGWDRRQDPNVALFHYRDYQGDLPGELQRMAEFLGYELDPQRARELAAEAGIEQMRARAEELAPDTGRNHWRDTSYFFRRGSGGEWSDRFDEALSNRYLERIEEYAQGDGDFVAWLHGGHRALS